MLYDKRWERTETKPDVFSLESLIAWLETMPADKIYCYGDMGRCLMAQFSASIGRTYEGCMLPCGEDLTLEQKMERISIRLPHTFGAALERARAAL